MTASERAKIQDLEDLCERIETIRSARPDEARQRAILKTIDHGLSEAEALYIFDHLPALSQAMIELNLYDRLIVSEECFERLTTLLSISGAQPKLSRFSLFSATRRFPNVVQKYIPFYFSDLDNYTDALELMMYLKFPPSFNILENLPVIYRDRHFPKENRVYLIYLPHQEDILIENLDHYWRAVSFLKENTDRIRVVNLVQLKKQKPKTCLS